MQTVPGFEAGQRQGGLVTTVRQGLDGPSWPRGNVSSDVNLTGIVHHLVFSYFFVPPLCVIYFVVFKRSSAMRGLRRTSAWATMGGRPASLSTSSKANMMFMEEIRKAPPDGNITVPVHQTLPRQAQVNKHTFSQQMCTIVH